MRILIIENGYRDLVSSRFPLGDFFENKGHFVRYACPKVPDNSDVYDLNINRSKFSPLLLLSSLMKLKKIEKDQKIDTVLSFRLTSNILNYFSSFFGLKKNRVAIITGLGYSFVYKKIKYRILKKIISSFYRLAEQRLSVVAQNKDDLVDLHLKNGQVILGSGVKQPDVKNSLLNESSKDLNLLFVGRLLKSKGINDAINVFQEVQKHNRNIRLIIAGDIDMDNPDSISKEDLLRIKNIKGVEYLSYVENMKKIYSKCNILLFPSFYREGVPRVIIEALSYGLTIITKDMPGCRETISNNGVLLKKNYVKDASNYINLISINDIINNKKESIKIFNEKFSSKVIFPKYLKTLLSNL